MSDVDFILNNWFGEPPEHSDNERARTRHLYEPLREIERQRDQLLAALEKPATCRARRKNRFTGEWSEWLNDLPFDFADTVKSESVADEWEIQMLYTAIKTVKK